MRTLPVNKKGGGSRVDQKKPSDENAVLTPCEIKQIGQMRFRADKVLVNPMGSSRTMMTY